MVDGGSKMKLTKNFSLEEFVRSDTAESQGIKNNPSELEVYKITILCVKLLQPLRDKIEKPIIIDSGYRSEKLNKIVGGVEDSQHTLGEAADFHVKGMDLKDAFGLLQRNFVYDQVILELDKWIHVSYNLFNNRKEALVAYSENERIRYEKFGAGQ
jgi:zinc D-Ala-D-Ala carboxypeptidase